MQNTYKDFKQLAIIGSTASGKTSLAIKIAHKMDAYILSLDSLSIYKEIDIVSAKPTLEEREGIIHFGLDQVYPNEHFDVTIFIELYQKLYKQCMREEKNIVIVGGTSFYLKMLLEGISKLPLISKKTKEQTKIYLENINETYKWLYSKDNTYMSKIALNDVYRIEKALNIYLETNLTPSEYFSQFPPSSTINLPLDVYQIIWDRSTLRERIDIRTKDMIHHGLIDEVCLLEKKYGRSFNPMKAIGIKETLAYLDGIYNKKVLMEKIITNTARLAKRQTTFNNSQFNHVIQGSIDTLGKILL